jgi:hypothetical protein
MAAGNNNRVKKLVMVEEDKLPRDVQEQIMGGGGEGGGSRTSNMLKQQAASPFSTPLEREIISFNDDIQQVMKKPLPTKLKALELLRKINRYFAYKQQWEDQQRNEVMAMREQHPTVSTSSPPEEMASATSKITVAPPKQIVRVDPASVERYGRESQLFSRANVVKSLHNRIKPRFLKLLDELETKDGFGWDTSTGEVMLNRQRVDGTSIRDLLLHKVREDIKDPIVEDPPPRYKKFALFLRRYNITSDPVLRSAKSVVAAPVQTRTKAGKRDKTNTLKQPAAKKRRLLNAQEFLVY